eukprot:410672_1
MHSITNYHLGQYINTHTHTTTRLLQQRQIYFINHLMMKCQKMLFMIEKIKIINKFTYSLDYHIQNDLLSINNFKIDCLGDLPVVLHEYKPNKFLFIKILQCDYFHKIYKGYTKLKGDHNSKFEKDPYAVTSENCRLKSDL